jgi:hypothetical protein
MLHRVSKMRVSKFWIGTALWLIAMFCIMHSKGVWAATATATVGLDAWSVPTNQVRYMPNYALPNGKTWEPFSQWAKGIASHEVDTDFGPVTFTAQGQYNTLIGGRVDRLDAAIRVTDSTGLRVGVLPYKTSWCRTYDANNPWMLEPDAFCRFSGLNEMAQGAFGAQIYRSDLVGGWLIDSMAGVYRPDVDGQSDKLGPYTKVGPNTLHKKVGASVNVMQLSTGIQARLAVLQTLQNQKSDTGSYERRLDYDTYYAAIEGNPLQGLTLRGSYAAYKGNQNNPTQLYAWDGQSKTLEAIYKPAQSQSIAFGVSKYTNVTTYSKAPNFQRVDVPNINLAWRKDWADGIHTVAQVTRSSDDSISRTGAVLTAREGNAIGFRLAKTF